MRHPVPGSLQKVARYLGPQLQFDSQLHVEKRLRLAAAKRAFALLSRFFVSTRDCKWKSVVYTCMVIGSLLTGLVAFSPNKAFLSTVDSLDATLCRKVVLGKGCDKRDGQYRAKRNSDVRLMLGSHTPSTQLRVQRIKWLQQMVRKPESHLQTIAVVFGHAQWETRPVISPQGQMCGKPHQWLEQMLSDLDALADRSNLSEAIDEIRSKPVLLFCDEAIRDVFILCDPDVLYANPVSIPPPGDISVSTGLLSTDADGERPFVCNIGDCRLAFPTFQALTAHQVHSQAPEHGIRCLASCITVSNQCLVCRNMYTSRFYAIRHLERALRTGTCPQSQGSATVFEHIFSPPFHCVLCNISFDSITAAQAHMVSHLPSGLDIVL